MTVPKGWSTLWVILLMAGPPLASASDWAQFGGPGRNLTVSDSGLFDGRPIDLEIVWKRPLGPGYSGFAVVGDRAVTLFSDGTSDVMVALRAATGEEIWRRAIGPTYKGHSGSDDGPLGTPTIHQGLVFAVGRGGELLAIRMADGEEVWSRRFDRDFGASPPKYGFSTSPMVQDGVLIVQAGGPAGMSIAGLDPENGKLLWATGDDPVDHQSPLPASFAGERQVVAVGQREMAGLRARTGQVLWRHRYRTDPEVWAQPVVIGSRGVFVSYYDSGGVFFQVSGEQKRVEIEQGWRSDLLQRSHVIPIYHSGLLYGFRGNLLFCVDPATGTEIWGSREPGSGGAIVVDGHLVTLAPRGHLVIGGISREGYVEEARIQALTRGSLTPPSLAGERFFVRNLLEATCVELRDDSL